MNPIMNNPEAVVQTILLFGVALAIGYWASTKNRSMVTWTIVSLLLTPIVGIAGLLLLGEGEPAG